MSQKIKFHAYLIQCLTNLHVGSGDNNYGIVDNQVQRDTITNTPVINSSSLKGSLREYFENLPEWGKNDSKISMYFGSDKNSANLEQGKLRFIEAKMLSIPIRGLKDEPFYLASSEKQIEMFHRDCEQFKLEQKIEMEYSGKKSITEYGDKNMYKTPSWLGDHAIDLGSDLIKAFKQLPIIARNSLDNGQSQNLWYEEIVPRESRFYFFIGVSDECANYEKEFEENLWKDIIQIGANATVGYGYCKISKMDAK